jgi:hypothetical protein
MGKAQTEAAAVARVRRRRLEMVMSVEEVGFGLNDSNWMLTRAYDK